MKKKKIIFCVVIFLVLVLLIPIPCRLKDGGTVEYRALLYKIVNYHVLDFDSEAGYNTGLEVSILGRKIYSSYEEIVSTVTENDLKDRRMIMLNGKLYYDTGKTSMIFGRCGVMDGNITSHVASNEIPIQDNQANFEGEYGFQFVGEDEIDLFIDNQWVVFKTMIYENEQLDISSLESELGGYITSESMIPFEVPLESFANIETSHISYSKVMKNEKGAFYAIIKTEDIDVVQKLFNYFSKNYKGYQSTQVGDNYFVYLFNESIDFQLHFNSIEGEIFSISERELLIKTEEGKEWRVHHNFDIKFRVGQKVKVTYNGNVNESLPPQIGTFYIEY